MLISLSAGFVTSLSSSDLRAAFTGKDVPEDLKSRLLSLHEDNVNLKEQYRTAQEKLVKARAVRPFRIHCMAPTPHFTDVGNSSSNLKTSFSRKSRRPRQGRRVSV